MSVRIPGEVVLKLLATRSKVVMSAQIKNPYGRFLILAYHDK